MTVQSDHTNKMIEKDQRLLEAIKSNLSVLTSLLQEMQDGYEDRIYRFYHQSFKVYSLQNHTTKAARIFKEIAVTEDAKLNKWFELIVEQGTNIEFESDHNQNWPLHTRSIVEAFLHAKYFVEMMVKYGNEIETAPILLPSGWAAILELYDQR